MQVYAYLMAFVFGAVFQRLWYAQEPAPRKVRATITSVLSSYLLLRIGFVGGTELAASGLAVDISPLVLALSLPFLKFGIISSLLRHLTRFHWATQTVFAGHFGSVSLGTFAAALALLDALAIPYNHAAGAWVALMELPAVLLAMLRLSKGQKGGHRLSFEAAEFTLLPASLLAGIAVACLNRLGLVLPTFEGLSDMDAVAFALVLCAFLFEMGRQAAKHIVGLGGDRQLLAAIGILLPLFCGTLGTALARLIGLNLADAMIFGTLAGSASYVAAPALLRKGLVVRFQDNPSIAETALAVSVGTALAITLPFNIIIGIHLYFFEAGVLTTQVHAAFLVVFLVGLLFCVLNTTRKVLVKKPC